MRRECWRDCAEKGVAVILNSPSGESVGEKWNNYSGLKGSGLRVAKCHIGKRPAVIL